MRKRERPCAYILCRWWMAASLSSEDKSTVERTLNELLNQDCGSDADCKGLLGVLEAHPELGGKVAEVLASFAREDAFRDVAVSCEVVPALCPLLTSGDTATLLHTLRAIGNLCYDHDGNRELVLSSGGCPLLVNQLTNCTLLPAKGEYDRLKSVSCGCLFNVINDNTKLCEEMLALKAVEHLSTLLATPGESDTTIDMGLKALFVLVTSGSNRPALLCPASLAPAFSHLLGHCVKDNLDLLLSVLETMEVTINISDDVKVAVIEAGCLEKLVQITDPSLQVKAINILILICANDSSLKLVSENSALISTAEQWLKDPGSLKRRANTALLFANMARTDEMCELFIARGVVPNLIKLTETEEPEELSGKVHVSGLSALRNLCLPVPQKPVLLEKGVLNVALRCLRDSEWSHVHFKSLGIARLLADQQEEACRQLVVSQPGTVALVCERCSSAEPPHVKIEGSRLMAALIKHSKSEEVMRAVVSEGGVKLMTSLLDSEHMLLRNEALVSLNLLAALRGGKEETAIMSASLTEEAVLLRVWGVITNANSSHQLLANALTLLLQLAQLDSVNIIEKLDGFDERMKVLSQHSSEAVRDKAKELTQLT